MFFSDPVHQSTSGKADHIVSLLHFNHVPVNKLTLISCHVRDIVTLGDYVKQHDVQLALERHCKFNISELKIMNLELSHSHPRLDRDPSARPVPSPP